MWRAVFLQQEDSRIQSVFRVCGVSGQLFDRIDMHVEVPPVPKEFLRDGGWFKTQTALNYSP